MRRKTYESCEHVSQAVEEQLATLKKEDIQGCFDQWVHRLKKCPEIGGEYVEKCWINELSLEKKIFELAIFFLQFYPNFWTSPHKTTHLVIWIKIQN